MTPDQEAIQSFCARVINLCHSIEEANSLTHIQTMNAIAMAIRKEAEGMQDVYGGRPRGGEKKGGKKKK